FPDVFHPNFESAVATWAKQLHATAADPALIGYFLMNEPKWGFAHQTPAEGMLRNTEGCSCRDALTDWLRDKYGEGDALPKRWGRADATLSHVHRGRWDGDLNKNAIHDLAAFSAQMIRHYWTTLSAATKAADPHHLNLGVRFASVPKPWARPGLETMDVFSFNSYARTPPDAAGKLSEDLGLPAIIGEFHFGATDAGLPAGALATVATQADRGKAYRRYVEAAAAEPWCVGAHWFTMYDQSALGRFDGEPYNCGFVDVCGRIYAEMADAATITHGRLLQLCRGEVEPFVGDINYERRHSV
ncbi:MAG: hypothetical protein AAGK78_02590, partial [Planctomycetota bacterium]